MHGVLMLRVSATGAAAPGEYPVSNLIVFVSSRMAHLYTNRKYWLDLDLGCVM